MKPDKVDALLNVRCRLETKYWQKYDHYRRNFKRPLLTSKIFSRHEAGAFDADPEILKKLLIANDAPPTSKMEWPETENQWYGWFTAPLTDRDRRDPKMYFPRPSTEISKLGGLLLADESRHKKKK